MLQAMTDGFTTLSGAWMGRYDYGAGQCPVSFEAMLQDDAGALSGQITEPNTFRRDMGASLTASLVGDRLGYDVTFRKIYAGFDQGGDPVYEGVLNAALDRIDGMWRFSNDPQWSGRFMMIRALRVRARRKIAVTADI